jgi:uncharacterized protein YdhG (YjbR/CyaY superfamily)
MNKPATIDEYIPAFPQEIQLRLNQIRFLVRSIVPDADEAIKYGMPTFIWNGNLVHFTAFKNHIGFYPAPADPTQIEIDLLAYKTGKGSIQFPHNRPLPVDIITSIIRWRVNHLTR